MLLPGIRASLLVLCLLLMVACGAESRFGPETVGSPKETQPEELVLVVADAARLLLEQPALEAVQLRRLGGEPEYSFWVRYRSNADFVSIQFDPPDAGIQPVPIGRASLDGAFYSTEGDERRWSDPVPRPESSNRSSPAGLMGPPVAIILSDVASERFPLDELSGRPARQVAATWQPTAGGGRVWSASYRVSSASYRYRHDADVTQEWEIAQSGRLLSFSLTRISDGEPTSETFISFSPITAADFMAPRPGEPLNTARLGVPDSVPFNDQ